MDTADIPPERFSPEGKEKWLEASELMRREILRLNAEMTDEFEKARAAAKRDDTLAEFHKMAAEAGKSLPEVLRAYVDMETLIRTDATRGVLKICENLGIEPVEFFQEYLASGEAA